MVSCSLFRIRHSSHLFRDQVVSLKNSLKTEERETTTIWRDKIATKISNQIYTNHFKMSLLKILTSPTNSNLQDPHYNNYSNKFRCRVATHTNQHIGLYRMISDIKNRNGFHLVKIETSQRFSHHYNKTIQKFLSSKILYWRNEGNVMIEYIGKEMNQHKWLIPFKVSASLKNSNKMKDFRNLSVLKLKLETRSSL